MLFFFSLFFDYIVIQFSFLWNMNPKLNDEDQSILKISSTQKTLLNDEMQKICAICLSPPKDEGAIACEHTFCLECISEWSWTKKSCPLCRKAFIQIFKLIDGKRVKQGLIARDRESRHRLVRLHMKLLVHAAECQNAQCPSANCHKMKILQAHMERCVLQAQGGCLLCRKMLALLTFHSRICAHGQCQVPHCQQLKANNQRSESCG
mmetsp:Transcript_16205/g.21092  ORF Transcript_16205/g.21092 Transcript_16205/m.21092 type:complete len:207 (-) Transcript_16205:107-727(-)